MSKEALSTSADILRLIGLAGLIIAPAVATIALDFVLFWALQENLKDHPFLSGMLYGSFIHRSGPIIFVPSTNNHGEVNAFETVLAIILSAISTASCAIACAFLGAPMIALGIAGAWAICFGLFLFGQGLHELIQENKISSPVSDIPISTGHAFG